jgi:hypothetical protein
MTNRFRLTLAALAAACALLAAGPAGLAGAQEDTGEIELEAVHPAGQSLHFIVRVTENGDPANDATVTAAAVSLSGESLAPVELPREDDDGTYSGPVEFPSAGLWTVRFTSTNPDATLEEQQEVDLSPSTTAGGDNQVTVGTEAGGGFAPEDDGTGGSAQSDEGESEDEGIPLWLIGAAAVVVIGGAIAALVVRLRGPGSGSGGDGGGGGKGPEPEPQPEPEAEASGDTPARGAP